MFIVTITSIEEGSGEKRQRRFSPEPKTSSGVLNYKHFVPNGT